MTRDYDDLNGAGGGAADVEHAVFNGRYRIGRRIGEGGMAVVFRGHDLLLNRPIAIKTLRPQYAANPTFRLRFEREAQSAAAFSHPNIIEIFDVGEDDGTPYIVMEHVHGQTLKEIIADEGPFGPDDVAALVDQVAAALDYAHERGTIHRDIKPQNILVEADGLARVVDFGIAKSLTDSDLTAVGSALGTGDYISPEQASGLMATPASDVYSLGVVAFEMLTKELPFAAETPVGVALRHVHDEPPRPSSLQPNLPRQIDAIVARALEKDPTRRFRSAGALAAALTDWRADGTTIVSSSVPPASPTGPAMPIAPNRARSHPPAVGSRAAQSPRSLPARQEPRALPAATANATGSDVGCSTWVVGIVLLVGLVGLILLGFRLSPRLSQFGTNPDSTTEVAVEGEVPATEQPVAQRPTSVPATEPPAPKLVEVPNVVGLALDQAVDLVTDRGLLLEEREPVAADAVPVDAVAQQAPQPSTRVPQGSTVYVQRSLGTSAIDLLALDLIGQDAANAENVLRERGLNVERREVGSADVAEGQVVALDPADRARTGDIVIVEVSKGDRVRIPGELQGQPIDDAVAQLERLGLRVVGRIAVSEQTIADAGVDLDASGIGVGDVVGVQDNGAAFGAWVARGTTVTVVYYDREAEAG